MEDGVLVTAMESVNHGKMRITVHQTADVTMIESVNLNEEKRRIAAPTIVDATRMLYVNLSVEKRLATVKIAPVILTGEQLGVALTPVQEGIWVQMGVNRMDELAIPLLLGLEQNALVYLHICI